GTLQEAFEMYKLLLDTFGLLVKSSEVSLGAADKTLDELLNLIIELRNEARKNKDYKTSDKIRDKLAEVNIVLEDSSKGTIWKIKK
ncbi:MAG: cysteine--tRNA ligase, partial [Candidatus Heimdallarchaeota archaeon]|nr:cysteine--tRNA ligase [Candidatus Heimdallarchaeota archaeon]